MTVDYVWLPAPHQISDLCNECAFSVGRRREDCFMDMERQDGELHLPCAYPDVVAIAKERVPEHIAKMTALKMGVS